MTDFETEYVFCKDYWLVLIVECLFAKASTANASASTLFSGRNSSFSFKATYSISERLGSYSKSGNFNKLYKNYLSGI